ncbi:MAG: tetratricopeptide repeat protein [Planctomycetes bacterium]|nr:tetratricopeptide repeat protein [Planctomycetota bacterium]
MPDFGDVYRPCRCGSGKKYKFCCLPRDRDGARSLAARVSAVPEGDMLRADEEKALGQRCLNAGDGAGAKRHFRNAIRLVPALPHFHNNLALAHYLDGEIEEALATVEKVDREVAPGNVFALGSLVHYAMVLGRDDAARAAGERLARGPAMDEDQAYKKCEGLARLGRHAEVLEAAKAGMGTARANRPSLAFFAGTACANLARYDEALAWLRQARGDEGKGERAERYERRLAKKQGPGTFDGGWPYLELQEWAPAGLLKRMQTGESSKQVPGLVYGLCDALEAGHHQEQTLQLLGLIGTPAALDVLRRIADGTWGTADLRTAALAALQRAGALPKDGPLKIWTGETWTEIETTSHRIEPGCAERAPEALMDRARAAMVALKEGRWEEAERQFRELAERAPRHAPFRHNRAVALEALGRDEEAFALLRALADEQPAYLMAHATLATMYLDRDRLEEAREAFRRIRLPNPCEPDWYSAYLMAAGRVALDDGKFDAAVRSFENLARFDDRPGMRRLAEDFAAEARERGRGDLSDRRAHERERSRLLSRDAGLEECFAGRTRVDLGGIALRCGVDLTRSTTKPRMIAAIARDWPARAPRIAEGLTDRSKRALAALLAAGGVAEFVAFTKAHEAAGPETPDGPGVMQELMAEGMVACGIVDGKASVVVPRELREGLALAVRL